ncbi:ArsR/SmtB family transcription factor [Fontibacillus sp. BL9]|uniref:ArsR/SmtB family transcription factor n=1 Tax=Fontibacillus sp. BL9 TaxID=3389971 RepID=UPI00397C30BD
MEYHVDIEFKPLYELMNSLHAYICRKSHKKIVLAPGWVKETRRSLTPEFASILDEMEVDNDWKLTYLLVYLCRDGSEVENFLAWLEGKSTGDLYELIAGYSQLFPKDMGQFRTRTLSVLSQWNDQYFKRMDTPILDSLLEETKQRKDEMASGKLELGEFIDRTTNGLVFNPKEGLERLVLVPQYHFQPINVISHFGKLTLCHYSARIYPENPAAFPLHEYHMIRALGENSRLKILRYLHQGPRSFTEIVRHLKLSKGITHDHISKLRNGGFIRAHFEGETLTEYSLRPEMLEHLHVKLMEYILQE